MNPSYFQRSRGSAKVTALLLLVVAALAGAVGWYVATSQHAHSHVGGESTGRKVVFYQSPMHPWIKSDQPGTCTICGMKLVPVYEGEKGFGDAGAKPAGLTLNKESANAIHVDTSPVVKQKLERTIRVAGVIDDDDSRHRKLSAYVEGRVDKLFVNFVGAEVAAGQPLAAFYSRDLLVARSEYTLATKMPAGPERETAMNGGRQKLRRMGLTMEQIDKLPGQTGDTFEIVAPQGGTVVSRNVYEGQYVKEGDVLFEIGDFSKMWFVFSAYERDLAWIRLGQEVEVTSSSTPGKTFRAPIVFIDPNLDPATRSARVRVVLENPQVDHHRQLLHKVYAEGRIKVESEPVLTIPRSAMLSANGEPIVYVQHEPGNYESRHIILGRVGEDVWEVVSGLNEGEKVVTSGNMLIDAQAQLSSGGQRPSEVAAVVPSFSDVQTKAAHEFLDAMVESGRALSADDLAGYNANTAKLHPAAMKLAEVLGVRGTQLGKIAHVAAAPTLATARKDFYPLSMIAADLTLQLRKQSPEFASFKVFECPMAKSAVPSAQTNAGRWLQTGAPLRNPFFGAEMLDCGEEVAP